MAKGQVRSNRETRKPKKVKEAGAAPAGGAAKGFQASIDAVNKKKSPGTKG
jgi:hypothetical protein